MGSRAETQRRGESSDFTQIGSKFTRRLPWRAVLGNFDMEYIKNWSVWLDLKIVWLTIWRGFGGKGAY